MRKAIVRLSLNRRVLGLLFVGFVWGNSILLWDFISIHRQAMMMTLDYYQFKSPTISIRRTTKDSNNKKESKSKRAPIKVDKSKHAIVVPYRNRTRHLYEFIDYMGPWLKRHFPNDHFTLWIVEQDDEELFNRAWLANVGLSQIMQHEPNTNCVILHDVDLIPNGTNSHVPYTSCEDKPIQLGSELEHWNWSMPYENYCGGVTSISLEHWKKINGMSNDYIGWGGEDDDLYHRLRMNGLLILPSAENNQTMPIPRRPPPGEGVFRALGKENETDHVQIKKHAQYEINKEIRFQMSAFVNSSRWKRDGLRDLYYNISDTSSFDILKYDKYSFQQHNRNGTTNATTMMATTPSVNKRSMTGFEHIHHIKAFAEDPNPPMPPPLEFIHIPFTGGQAITRAAARAGVVWGACHFGRFEEWDCHLPNTLKSGDLQYGPPYDGTYQQAIRPWLRPMSEFHDLLFANDVEFFTLVRNPYERAISYYRMNYDQQHGYPHGFFHNYQQHFPDLKNIPKYAADYLIERENPERMNAFLQDYFVNRYERSFPEGNDLSPQYFYIFPFGDQLVKPVLKYENFQASWDYIIEKYSNSSRAAQYNKINLPPPPRSIYDPTQTKKTDRTKLPRTRENRWTGLYSLLGLPTGNLTVSLKETYFLDAHDLEDDTVSLINGLYLIDFSLFHYSQMIANKTYLEARSTVLDKQKRNTNTIVATTSRTNVQLEYLPIPFTIEREMNMYGSKLGAVWGACHWGRFDDYDCPPGSGDLANSTVRFKVKNYLEAKEPWLLPTSQVYDELMKNTERFTVVRNPYERAIDFYRTSYDQRHGYPDGFKYHEPVQGRTQTPQWIAEYLIQRENPIRMNEFLQSSIIAVQQYNCPSCMEMIPQTQYIFKGVSIFGKYALKLGLSNLIRQMQQQGSEDGETLGNPNKIYVLYLENIEEDFAKTAKTLNWKYSTEVPLPLVLQKVQSSKQQTKKKRNQKLRCSWASLIALPFYYLFGWSTQELLVNMSVQDIQDEYFLTVDDLSNLTIAVLNKRYDEDFRKLNYAKMETDATALIDMYWKPEKKWGSFVKRSSTVS